MKKAIKILLIIEVQIILIVLLVLYFSFKEVNRKIFNTNSFIYELLQDKKLTNLNTENENDIIIGDKEAPITIFMYSRVDCSACDDFFSNTYNILKDKYINSGQVKLVIRYLVHESNPLRLFTTKQFYCANENNYFDIYNNHLSGNKYLDSISIINEATKYAGNASIITNYNKNLHIDKYLLNTAQLARQSGITSTPTFFIGRNKIVGNRRLKVLEKLIKSELEINACE
ncbi:DsbA family protein [Saccharicrinis aurantiacus]|uniref:DsbA family protein n=1 Tax=Saccharicrinis aurantiacus TaxID=1849719 RepID=UPI0024925582|nr:DsbA family protein [Saccharicrinis aurantiacus]